MPRVWRDEMSDHEVECREQHLQLAMDTVLALVQQVKITATLPYS